MRYGIYSFEGYTVEVSQWGAQVLYGEDVLANTVPAELEVQADRVLARFEAVAR